MNMVISLLKHKENCNVIANIPYWDKKHGDLRRMRSFLHPLKYREMYLKLEQLESFCTCGIVPLAGENVIETDISYGRKRK